MRMYFPVVVAAVIAAGAVYYGRHAAAAREVVVPPAQPEAMAATTASMPRRSHVPVPVRPSAGEAERVTDPTAPPDHLVLPIEGLHAADIQDTFNSARGGGARKHEATDILAARGTPVRAMADGTIKKLFLSKPGGITVYEFDLSGEFCYYYAHLDHYAEGLHEGQAVRAGDLIGYVGTTGNADPNTPHLHLAFFRLGPEKRWWKGTPVNPYPSLMRLVNG